MDPNRNRAAEYGSDTVTIYGHSISALIDRQGGHQPLLRRSGITRTVTRGVPSYLLIVLPLAW